MSMSIRHKVMVFHRRFGVPILDRPGWPPEQRVDLRMSLIEEEWLELVDAVRARDLVATADALCDLAYVVEGMCLECEQSLRFLRQMEESEPGA